MKFSQNKVLVWALGTLIVLLTSYVIYVKFFYDKNKEKEQKPYTVEAEKVRRGGIMRKITVGGALIANDSVELTPVVPGKVAAILFKPGEKVKKGDPLIQLEDETFKAKVKEAEAALLFAKADYARYLKLAEANAGPGRKKEESYSQMLSAEAKLDQAQVDLKNSIISAPFEGTVGLKSVSVGDYVTNQKPILSIVDEDPIKIDFKVPENYIKNISKDQDISVSVDGFGEQVFIAKVEAIDAKVDPNAHSLEVHAVMDNKSGLLKPGLFARVKIEVGHKENAIIVPLSSLKITGEDAFVYKVVDVNTAQYKGTVAVKTKVIRGITEGSQVEIENGLNDDDRIITAGIDKVKEGSIPVRVVADVDAPDEGPAKPAKPAAPKGKK